MPSGNGGSAALPQQAGTGGIGGDPSPSTRGGNAAFPPQPGSVNAGTTGGGSAGATGEDAIRFTRIYDTFFITCRSEVCHGGPLDVPNVGLDMQTRDSAYLSLVGRMAAATGPCGNRSLMRVVPFEPEKSLLFLKVAGTPPCGDEMPPAATNSKENIDLLRAWIAAGALNN